MEQTFCPSMDSWTHSWCKPETASRPVTSGQMGIKGNSAVRENSMRCSHGKKVEMTNSDVCRLHTRFPLWDVAPLNRVHGITPQLPRFDHTSTKLASTFERLSSTDYDICSRD